MIEDDLRPRDRYIGGEEPQLGDEVRSDGLPALVVGLDLPDLLVQLPALPPPWGTGIGWTTGEEPCQWLAWRCSLVRRGPWPIDLSQARRPPRA